MFLLPSINMKLRPKILDLSPGTRIVTNSFTMEDWQADQSETVTDDCSNWCTAHLWIVPAKVEGTWQIAAREPDAEAAVPDDLRDAWDRRRSPRGGCAAIRSSSRSAGRSTPAGWTVRRSAAPATTASPGRRPSADYVEPMDRRLARRSIRVSGVHRRASVRPCRGSQRVELGTQALQAHRHLQSEWVLGFPL